MARNVKCSHCGNVGNIKDTNKFNIIQRTLGSGHSLYRYTCKECGNMNSIKFSKKAI